ncbi:MAG: hypothetical protein JXA75_06080 [Candidatus Thermoplasmatota archaeon]|nr:hypothetical protein [Candidatus Thermoplasmatota archaeon]
MNESENRKKQHLPGSWEDASFEKEQLTQWQESAFHAAVEKLHTEHGTPDSAMRMGEAFGRGLYAQRLKDKGSEWTINEWLREIEKDVCKPLGTEFTFTKISPDVATTFMNRHPLAQTAQEQTAASLFNYGVLRGLFLSAFPKGELVLRDRKNEEDLAVIFKTYASAKDKLERDRVIHAFTVLKKEDSP